MDDLRGALERLSESGTPVGADAVYERARRRGALHDGLPHAPKLETRSTAVVRRGRMRGRGGRSVDGLGIEG